MSKRSGKFYRKNEKEVMESLGFAPTKNSGSGWIEKEDGENEFALCQLKSTDADSIRIHLKDLETLEYHALVSHKVPIFAIQFLKSSEVFLLIRPEGLYSLRDWIENGIPYNSPSGFPNPLKIENRGPLEFDLGNQESEPERLKESNNKSVIKSSATKRKSFMKSHEEKFKKKSKSAK